MSPRTFLTAGCGVLVSASTISSLTAAPAQKDGDPVGIGTYRTLHSAILGEDRQLLVHVPADYDRTMLRYPVLFQLYGQQVTNYLADAVMNAERLGNFADIPPLIVVGVANTDRYRDNLPIQADGTSPGGADAFLRFFAEELIPFIDRNYRTKPYRVLVGPQAGAAFGLYALVTRPGLFNASILRIENPFPGQPAFRQYFLDKAARFVQGTPRLNAYLRLNVDSGVSPLTVDFAKQLAAIVEGSLPDGFRFELHEDGPSGDFVPLVGLAPALRSLFAGYSTPASALPDSVEAFEGYYRQVSERLGVELEPPQQSLTLAVDRLIENRRLDAALELVTYELRIHGDTLNALFRLGDINRRLGRPREARDAYQRFLAIQPNDAALIRQRLAEVEQAIEAERNTAQATPALALVSFPTDDGGRVYADLSGSGSRGVVLAHGGRFTKESWATQARALADAGFRVLAIDFRGRGQSRGGPRLAPGDEGLRFDVLAAVRYLRDNGATWVAVVGGSMGGGAAAEAAIETTSGEIDRLVLLAHAPIAHPERIAVPTLFILARDDPQANGTPRLVAIREQYEKAAGPKELVVLDGSAHAQYLFDTDQGDRLMREILRFLSAR